MTRWQRVCACVPPPTPTPPIHISLGRGLTLSHAHPLPCGTLSSFSCLGTVMPSERGGEWWPETRQPTVLVYCSASANTEGPLVSLLNLHLDALSSNFPRCVLVIPAFLLEVRHH